MAAQSKAVLLDRDTEIGALSDKVRIVVKRGILPMTVVLGLEAAYLSIYGLPGASALALIGAGTCISLAVWSSSAIGLPLLPMMVIQNLVIYGVPIAVGHEVIMSYPAEFVLSAGVETLVFNIVMALAWKMGMQMFHPSPPVSYTLSEFNKSGVKGWAKLGFGMIIAATTFEVLEGLGVLDSLFSSLPEGSSSIIYAMVSVVSACGFFLVSMIIGGNSASFMGKMAFWGLLILNGMISASDFLLASAAANLITVAIGFFWSNGKVPWRYLTVAMLTLSFLNTGKTTMRERYWGNGDTDPIAISLQQMPAIYAEWSQASYRAVLENSADDPRSSNARNSQANKNQTLLDRIDNLQNLLFVIDAVETDHVSLLHGKTYSLIPPLLVPRVLWPDKPRSHEGQVLLNVHFGRQDLNSTFATYIAWGLLPEAYGNFGPIAGSIILGFFLGIIFAWVENLTARKAVMSMEGFLSLSLLMNLMNSFEMVASVLVTTIFQSFVIIIAASFPFVQRTVLRKAAPTSD